MLSPEDKKLIEEAEALTKEAPLGPPDSAMTAARFIAESGALIPRLVARLRAVLEGGS